MKKDSVIYDIIKNQLYDCGQYIILSNVGEKQPGLFTNKMDAAEWCIRLNSSADNNTCYYFVQLTPYRLLFEIEDLIRAEAQHNVIWQKLSDEIGCSYLSKNSVAMQLLKPNSPWAVETKSGKPTQVECWFDDDWEYECYLNKLK